MAPEVSVCIPAYNTARFIRRTVESVLAQTYSDFEAIVVDDASTDGTLEQLQELDDPRVRLYSNSRNVGQAVNWNRSIALARGRFIKFLCSDDLIYQDCLERMVELFRSHPRVGIVFSLRDIEVEAAWDPLAAEWEARHARPHAVLGDLERVNSGPALLDRWIATGLRRNAVGEPTNVMVSRECLRRVGTFNVALRQRVDMDLWMRAMSSFDVGFIDRSLARYVIRSGSVTSRNRAASVDWMDGVWLLEGLLGQREIRDRWPQLYPLRRRAAAGSFRHALRSAALGDFRKVGALGRYLAFRLRRGARKPTDLYGTLEDRGPPGETVERPTRVAGGRREPEPHSRAPTRRPERTIPVDPPE